MNRPSKYTYAAVFTPEADGAYSIRFPQLEGCFSKGSSFDDDLFVCGQFDSFNQADQRLLAVAGG